VNTYRINRLAFVGTLLGLVIGLVAIAGMPPADAGRNITPRMRAEVRFQHVAPAHWTDREVRMSIRAAVKLWPVPGGVDKALSVARCESGFEATDSSPGSGYEGVFQQATAYWPSRLATYDSPRWALHDSVNNARSNVVVSIRMAHAGGWGPWGCA
jgi:hypothetical protein